MSAVTAFDRLAPAYDATFTETVLGRAFRSAVWRWLDAAFAPGQRVLELGCGTGEDAVHLGQRGVRVLATDASAAMVAAAREKVAAAGLAGVVRVRQLDLERLPAAEHWGGEEGPPSLWDGAVSSLGVLNCVRDAAPVAGWLGDRLRSGARAVLGLMGPLAPWEWAWFFGRGVPRAAFRRLRPGGTAWRGLTVRYPAIGATRRAFAPWFRLRRLGALGALLPGTYAASWAARHPLLVERLARWERRLESVPPLPWLADHYLMELERR